MLNNFIIVVKWLFYDAPKAGLSVFGVSYDLIIGSIIAIIITIPILFKIVTKR